MFYIDFQYGIHYAVIVCDAILNVGGASFSKQWINVQVLCALTDKVIEKNNKAIHYFIKKCGMSDVEFEKKTLKNYKYEIKKSLG